jgi:hypothetical protein
VSRAEQGKALAVASLAFVGAAAGTSFSGSGMTVSAAIAMSTGLVVAVLGLVYSRRIEDVSEKERKDVFLNESVPCEGIKCPAHDWKHVRRLLWRVPDASRVCTGKAVCAECFFLLMNRQPNDATDKRAF